MLLVHLEQPLPIIVGRLDGGYCTCSWVVWALQVFESRNAEARLVYRASHPRVFPSKHFADAIVLRGCWLLLFTWCPISAASAPFTFARSSHAQQFFL